MQIINKGLFELRLETFKRYTKEGKFPGGYEAEHIQQMIDYSNYQEERLRLIAESNDTYAKQLANAEKELTERDRRLKNQSNSISSLYKDLEERKQFVDKQSSEIMALERKVADQEAKDALVLRQSRAWTEVLNLVRNALPASFISVGPSSTNKEVVLEAIRKWATEANRYETLVDRIDEAIDEIEEEEDNTNGNGDSVVFDESADLGCLKYGAVNWERQFREWNQR